MPAKPVPTPNAPPVAGPYSPAVRAGDWLVLAGQIGFDPASGEIPTRLGDQARQALANVATVLADCGGALTDVAKVTVFTTAIGNMGEINDVYAEAFGSHRPARSTIGVAGLPADAAIEIEVWAYVPA
ncbi:MAG TPA: Rid family detoxifying hydrolase [Acidimicrobiia bacterium]|nr:Rid family detoxifying hydrolase [Acidimicrobiia bacterium]